MINISANQPSHLSPAVVGSPTTAICCCRRWHPNQLTNQLHISIYSEALFLVQCCVHEHERRLVRRGRAPAAAGPGAARAAAGSGAAAGCAAPGTGGRGSGARGSRPSSPAAFLHVFQSRLETICTVSYCHVDLPNSLKIRLRHR